MAEIEKNSIFKTKDTAGNILKHFFITKIENLIGGPLGIDKGGTGQETAEAARTALGAASKEDVETAQTTANTGVTNAAAAQSGVNAINSAKGAANGIATLDTNSKVTAAQASATGQIKSASATLVLADAGTLIRASSSSTITITIPAETSVNFPIGTEIEFCRWGVGEVVFAGDATIVSADGLRSIARRYGCAAIKKVYSDGWLLCGDLG